MLAVLLIKMEWWKESRTPAAAAVRQQYYKPIKIEDEGVENYAWIKRLETHNVNLSSWLYDVLNCVNDIKLIAFCLWEIMHIFKFCKKYI